MENPNILYILADDLGWGDLSMHGSLIGTPFIDQLAREGVELTQHYVCPMCTPTIVNWRSRLSSGKVDHPVQVVDWMPTFTKLTGAEPAEDPLYGGQDIWPLITGEEADPAERSLFWNFRGDRVLGARHGDWKLISRDDHGCRQNELYNIREDPYEERDLVKDYPNKSKLLTDMIEAERQQDGSSARQDVISLMVS